MTVAMENKTIDSAALEFVDGVIEKFPESAKNTSPAVRGGMSVIAKNREI